MYGFELIKKENIKELSAEAFLYRHNSGARLVFVKNNDENRIVMPVFKTLPTNDKGIPHIVEHCTLCGSENYPLKDPFNTLEKGSIYTYLNAITYEDKTVYPVASIDKEELMKMVKVYADGIFKPLFLEEEGIFMQEGIYCNYEGVNGVVLNEMEGVFASEHKLLSNSLTRHLYKDCNYKYYSGGVPSNIKTLTYEEFKEFYLSTYTAENCLIYIYGDVEIETYAKLFSSYFGESKAKLADTEINVNNDPKPVKVRAGKGAKGVCGAKFACADADSYMETVLLSVLGDVLISGDNSVLRQAFVDSGRAVDVSGGYNDSVRATNFSFYGEGIAIDEFKSILQDTLEHLCLNGIPEDKLKKSVDRLKFYVKERDFGYKPTGLFYGLELMKGMLYENISFEPLRLESALDKAQNADYISLIKKYFLNKGVYGYTVDEQAEVAAVSLPINDAPLKVFQSKKDREEILNKIPSKKLSEIKAKPIWYDYSFDKGCLFTEDNKSHIVYLDLIYPIDKLNLCCTAFYAYVLNDEMNRGEGCFGRIDVSTEGYFKEGIGLPVLKISTAFTKENINRCIKTLGNMKNIAFDDKNKLNRLALEQRAKFTKAFSVRGDMFAQIYGLACVNKEKVFYDLTSGVGMYRWLCCHGDLSEEIKKVSEHIKNTLPIAVLRGDSEVRENVINNIDLSPTPFVLKETDYKICTPMGFVVNTNVNYSCLAFKIPYYNGAMSVVSDIIQRSYIWDKIRLEGGAYGGGCGFDRDKTVYISSYRDPQLERTEKVFRSLGAYLEELKLSDSELNRFVLGNIARLMKPVKNKSINRYVLSQFVLNKTYDRELEYVQERLLCTGEDINKVGGMLKDCINKGAFVTFGGENIKSYFDNIYII